MIGSVSDSAAKMAPITSIPIANDQLLYLRKIAESLDRIASAQQAAIAVSVVELHNRHGSSTHSIIVEIVRTLKRLREANHDAE